MTKCKPTAKRLDEPAGTDTARAQAGQERGTVTQTTAAGDISAEVGDAFSVATGFDPRDEDGYLYFRIRPRLLQAWREANELLGRTLMRDGEWLVG